MASVKSSSVVPPIRSRSSSAGFFEDASAVLSFSFSAFRRLKSSSQSSRWTICLIAMCPTMNSSWESAKDPFCLISWSSGGGDGSPLAPSILSIGSGDVPVL